MAVSRTALPYDPPDLCSSEPDPSDTTPSGVTLTAAELAAETGAEPDRAGRVLPVATAIVVEYAPEAPTPILNEAVIRLAGYILSADYGTIREEELGPRRLQYPVNHAMMFRNSGAQALLTRFKKRRAGAL